MENNLWKPDLCPDDCEFCEYDLETDCSEGCMILKNEEGGMYDE